MQERFGKPSRLDCMAAFETPGIQPGRDCPRCRLKSADRMTGDHQSSSAGNSAEEAFPAWLDRVAASSVEFPRASDTRCSEVCLRGQVALVSTEARLVGTVAAQRAERSQVAAYSGLLPRPQKVVARKQVPHSLRMAVVEVPSRTEAGGSTQTLHTDWLCP